MQKKEGRIKKKKKKKERENLDIIIKWRRFIRSQHK